MRSLPFFIFACGITTKQENFSFISIPLLLELNWSQSTTCSTFFQSFPKEVNSGVETLPEQTHSFRIPMDNRTFLHRVYWLILKILKSAWFLTKKGYLISLRISCQINGPTGENDRRTGPVRSFCCWIVIPGGKYRTIYLSVEVHRKIYVDWKATACKAKHAQHQVAAGFA